MQGVFSGQAIEEFGGAPHREIFLVKCLGKTWNSSSQGASRRHHSKEFATGRSKRHGRAFGGQAAHRDHALPYQVNEQILDLTLRFILSLKHVSMLSWGQKEVNLDLLEKVKLPVLTQRLPPKLMWDSYKICAK